MIRRKRTSIESVLLTILLILVASLGYVAHSPEIIERETNNIYYKNNNEGWYVVGTYYNAVEAQCNKDPLHTASGYKIDIKKLNNYELRVCAVSQDFIRYYDSSNTKKPKLQWHDTIIVESNNEYLNGEWIVEDYMNGRYTNCIDFLLPLQDTLNIGKIGCKIKKK